MIRSYADFRYRVNEKYREWQLGIETARVFRDDGFHSNADRAEYTPVPFQALESALSGLGITDSDEFFDYGCGKGRALVIASLFPFRRVSGIELIPELHRRAEENLRRTERLRRCFEVEVLLGDAASHELSESVTVVFLWNPFIGSVLDAVIGQIRASFVRRPRPLRILHLRWSEQPEPFAACEWLSGAGSLPTWPSARPTELNLYQTRDGG